MERDRHPENSKEARAMKVKFGWIVLLAVVLAALAAVPDLWAAPGQSPHRQTVPTRTPSPGPTSPPTATQPPPPSATEPPPPPPSPTVTPPPSPTATPPPRPPSPTAAGAPAVTGTPSPSPVPSPTPLPLTPTALLRPSPTTGVSLAWTPVPVPLGGSAASSGGISPLLIAGLGLIAAGLILLFLFGRRRAG